MLLVQKPIPENRIIRMQNMLWNITIEMWPLNSPELNALEITTSAEMLVVYHRRRSKPKISPNWTKCCKRQSIW